MKKKLLGMLFVLGLLLALPSVVSFAGFVASGTCGATDNEDNVKWTLDDEGTFTISGTGTMKENYSSNNDVPWESYLDKIKTAKIGDNVSNIGNRTFRKCTNLKSIIIPKSVAKIGNFAFRYCENLTLVIILGEITDIGDSAFDGCTNLKDVYYVDKKISIKNKGNGALENAAWHDINAFCGARVVFKIVDGTLTISGSGAMADYDAASSVPWNGSVADIKTVVIGEGVTSIGNYAFNGCENLISVVIPTGVTQIGDNAFNDCNKLANVYYTGTKAEWDALTKGSGNDYLTNATLHYHCGATAGDNVYWALVGDTLTISGSGAMADYADASSVPWNNSITAIKTVGIENGVTHVGAYAFSGCENLTSVTIARSVKNIGNNVFYNCGKLVNVYYAGTREEWNSIEGRNSLTSANISYCICGAKGNEANVTWSLENNTLTISGSGAMRDYAAANEVPWNDSIADIKTVVIGEGVTSIGNYAFSGCENLTSVVIPTGVTHIGDNAFSGCTSLISLAIPDGVTNIGSGVFSGCTSLMSVTIPGGVTSIGDNAFKDCTSLKSVTIPEGATSIEDNTFNGCTSLISLTIPDSVTNIGSGVFSGCTSLGLVTIPKSVTSVGDNAFKDCTSLKSVTIPEGVTSIEDNTFNGCTSLISLTIPDSVTNIGSGVFSGCTSLGLVTIPKSVTSVGDNAFKDCTSLKSVTIPEGVTSIGDNAFSGCVKLTAIYIPEGCSVGTSAIPYVDYRVEHTTKNKDKNIDDEKIVVITSVIKSDESDPIKLNCDSMGNGYYIIKSEAGESVALSTVCEPDTSDTTKHTGGYSMRRREKITDKDHVYGYVIDGERRCIDCGDVQTCKKNGDAVKLGGLTYQCYTCGDGIEVVELNLAEA